MDIKATTKIYGIFGHPVSHSLSPVMHNRAFGELGMDCVYLGFDVKPGKIGAAVESIRTLNLQGINITIPHKESMVSLLDEVTQPVVLTGAVNTVKNEHGKLTGYNTDVPGVMRAIREELDFEPEDKRALIYGAGGACRAVVAAMCINGISRVMIVNRTLERARMVVDSFKVQFQHVIFETCPLDDDNAVQNYISESDIVINSTSAGMGDVPALKVPLENAGDKVVVYDLVYKPYVTPLVKQARDMGINAHSGLGMLLYQGVEAFEIWTGKKAPVDVMKDVLLRSR